MNGKTAPISDFSGYGEFLPERMTSEGSVDKNGPMGAAILKAYTRLSRFIHSSQHVQGRNGNVSQSCACMHLEMMSKLQKSAMDISDMMVENRMIDNGMNSMEVVDLIQETVEDWKSVGSGQPVYCRAQGERICLGHKSSGSLIDDEDEYEWQDPPFSSNHPSSAANKRRFDGLEPVPIKKPNCAASPPWVTPAAASTTMPPPTATAMSAAAMMPPPPFASMPTPNTAFTPSPYHNTECDLAAFGEMSEEEKLAQISEMKKYERKSSDCKMAASIQYGQHEHEQGSSHEDQKMGASSTMQRWWK